jgi:hypothetical protein
MAQNANEVFVRRKKMGSVTSKFGLFKPALSDDADILAAVSGNMQTLDEKAALNEDVENRTVMVQEDDYRKSIILNDPGGDGVAIRDESKVTHAVAALETNMEDSGVDFAEGAAGAAPSGAIAGGYVYGADGTKKSRFALTLKGLMEQLTGGRFRLVRTDVQTVSIPASAWDTDGTATVAVPGMRANMSQGDFRVGREHASQIPVEAAAGLGDTDIIPGDGTITLTATGVIPTTALSLIVTIYGREG